MKVKIHLIPVIVLDFEGYGLKGCAELLGNVRHLDHTHPQLDQARTVEVEWGDDHPLNQRATADAARAKLFPDEWKEAVHDALLPLALADTPRASVAKLVEWEKHLATAPELQQPMTKGQSEALQRMIGPKVMLDPKTMRPIPPELPQDFQYFNDPDTEWPRFNLKAEPQYSDWSDVEPGHFYGLLLNSGRVRIYYRGFNDPDPIRITEVENLAEGCDYLRASLGTKPNGVDFPQGT